MTVSRRDCFTWRQRITQICINKISGDNTGFCHPNPIVKRCDGNNLLWTLAINTQSVLHFKRKTSYINELLNPNYRFTSKNLAKELEFLDLSEFWEFSLYAKYLKLYGLSSVHITWGCIYIWQIFPINEIINTLGSLL